MYDLYKRIEDMCEAKGVKVGKMCADIGIQRSVMGNLSSGKSKTLSTKTLQSIANYFKVSVDYLLDQDWPGAEDAPPEPEITDSQLIFALWKDNPNNMTKEDLDRVRSFARYLAEEKGNQN